MTEDELCLGIGYAEGLETTIRIHKLNKIKIILSIAYNWQNKITLKSDKVPGMADTDLTSPSWSPLSLEEEMVAGTSPDQGKIVLLYQLPNHMNQSKQWKIHYTQ